MAVTAPPGTKPPTTTDNQRLPPNQSIYINNLNEQLQKDDLRRALYMLFSTYGPVIDITALKTSKMRGQAHILFKDVNSATQALRSCQGMEFFGREMKISYSKNRSNTLAKLTGTFNQPVITEQQKQITQAASSFPGPPGALPAPPGLPQPTTLPGPPSSLPPPPGLPPPAGLPAKINGEPLGLKAPEKEVEDVASPQGVKRLREESDDEEKEDESSSDEEAEEVTMDNDEEDEEGAMEMSEDDDDE